MFYIRGPRPHAVQEEPWSFDSRHWTTRRAVACDQYREPQAGPPVGPEPLFWLLSYFSLFLLFFVSEICLKFVARIASPGIKLLQFPKKKSGGLRPPNPPPGAPPLDPAGGCAPRPPQFAGRALSALRIPCSLRSQVSSADPPKSLIEITALVAVSGGG